MSESSVHSDPRPLLRDAQVRAVATEFLRRRPAIVIPFLVFTVVVLAFGGAPRAQLVALGSAGTLFAAFFLHERHVGSRQPVSGATLLRSLAMTAFGIGVAATATGALASPLLPMFFAPIGIGFAAFGRDRRSSLLLGLLVGIVVVLFLTSPLVSPLVPTDGPRQLILAAAVIDAALLLRVGVASLAVAHGRAADTLAVAGEEMIRAAEARTRSLETLGAKVAHEVKNPLAAIRALVEVMLESGDERARKRLTVAAGEIARIEQIVEGYASLTHPLDVVRRADTDVSALVGDLIAVLEARATRRGIELVLDHGHAGNGALGIRFDLDRDRMKEALLNLLSNAIDATPSGGSITLGCTLTAERALELRITDKGKGMDAATLARIGTPFFTQREGGTGLGVALARQVAAQHGGALTYESTPGAGTTALLHIPATTSEPEPQRDAPNRSHL